VTRAAPYRESGHQLLIESLVRNGNFAEALRAYDSLRQLLQRDLGIAPSPEMRELHARLLRQA
jgi:pentatricopeptide repeat protein